MAKSSTEWYELCRQRHLCEEHTLRLLNQLTARCIIVFLTDEDDLQSFSDFLARGVCPIPMLKCVLMEILKKTIR